MHPDRQRTMHLCGKLGFTDVEELEEYGAEQWFGP
jgi:hypothetical protein